jgi:hypothetical protein
MRGKLPIVNNLRYRNSGRCDKIRNREGIKMGKKTALKP